MKTDLAPTLAPDLTSEADVSLLPRADLPVIWDAFKAKAEKVRATAETLTVTCITQKDEMALARTTRLTLREIRIAVEAKRVELGESHLKEIKKVNGAATAIKEFIQPLEARLLIQEEFGERAEAARIAELSKSRNAELNSVRPGTFVSNAGQISQADFDAYIARLRSEQAEIEAANRARIEAESRLAAQKLEMELREVAIRAEAQAEAQRVAEVTRAALELAQRVALDVKNKRDAEVRAELDRQRAEANAILNAKLEQQRKEAEALEIQRTAEHKAEREEYERKAQVAREEAEANARAEATYLRQEQERLRIRDEQLAVLEAELAQERAAKQAEADAARKLALAPDVEKLRAFVAVLRDGVKGPVCDSPQAKRVVEVARLGILSLAQKVEDFCDE